MNEQSDGQSWYMNIQLQNTSEWFQSLSYRQSGNFKTRMSSDTKKLRGLNPQANYTDRATAACRRS
jgi:hypothetical protein